MSLILHWYQVSIDISVPAYLYIYIYIYIYIHTHTHTFVVFVVVVVVVVDVVVVVVVVLVVTETSLTFGIHNFKNLAWYPTSFDVNEPVFCPTFTEATEPVGYPTCTDVEILRCPTSIAATACLSICSNIDIKEPVLISNSQLVYISQAVLTAFIDVGKWV
jgi:hypothetical protein